METGLTPSFFHNVDWTGVVQSGPGRVGAFELRAPLGRGAEAEVWRATHVMTKRASALRFLVAEGARSAEAHLSLRRDARRIARLDHPAVVQLYEVGTAGEEAERVTGGRVHRQAPFVAMEQLRGPFREAWAHAIASGRRGEVLPWLDRLLDGLAYSHARGVIHGDIKPSNVMLRGTSPACPVWIDFGGWTQGVAVAAREVDGRYGAPEELRGQEITAATDIYRFALLAAEVLTGDVPFAETPRRRLFGAPDLKGLDDEPAVRDWLVYALDPRSRFADACEGALRWPRSLDLGATPRGNDPMPSTLALHRLRQPSFVGRDEERFEFQAKADALTRWGTSFAMAIHGPSGSGKTRFIEWATTWARRKGLHVVAEGPQDPGEFAAHFLEKSERRSIVFFDDLEPEVLRGLRAAVARSAAPIGVVMASANATEGSYALSPLTASEQAALATVLGLHARVRVPPGQQPGELVRRVSDSLRDGSLVMHEGRLVPRRGDAEANMLFEPTFAHAFAEDVLAALSRFGQHIGREWHIACAGVEMATREELMDYWVTEGIVTEPGESGFSLRDRSRCRTRWETLTTPQRNALDATCAAALEELPDAASAARRARHLLASGARDAQRATLDAAERLLRTLRVQEALGLLAEVGESDEADVRIRGALARARGLRLRGDRKGARQALSDARKVAKGIDDAVWGIRCDQRGAGLARSDGDLDEAVRLSLRAFGAARRFGDPRVLATAALDLAASALAARVALPPGLLDDAAAAFEGVGDADGRVEVEVWRGRVAMEEDDLTTVKGAVVAAEALWARPSPHPGVETLRARLAIARGDLAGAETHLRRAGEVYIALGHGISTDVELRLGGVLIMQERWEDAWHAISNALAALEVRGRSEEAATAALALCALDVVERDWATFDGRLRAAKAANVPLPSGVRGAIAWTLERLGDIDEDRRDALAGIGVEKPSVV